MHHENADGASRATIELDMDGPTEINALALEEASGLTGHVQDYKVEGQVNSDWKLLSQGTTIGERKVDRFPKVTVWKVRLTILKAQPYPAIRKFGLYLDIVSPRASFEPENTSTEQ
jgi:alpha-L-fucosidase